MFKAIIDFFKVKPVVPTQPVAPYKVETPPVVAQAAKPAPEVKPVKKKPAAKPGKKADTKPATKPGPKPTRKKK